MSKYIKAEHQGPSITCSTNKEIELVSDFVLKLCIGRKFLYVWSKGKHIC